MPLIATTVELLTEIETVPTIPLPETPKMFAMVPDVVPTVPTTPNDTTPKIGADFDWDTPIAPTIPVDEAPEILTTVALLILTETAPGVAVP
jgi:hypothetical protein